MSYILEALKKAEHEREIGQVPRIDSEHEPASARVSSRWVMLVVLVLLVNAGLLLVLFRPDGSTKETEPVAGAPLATLPGIDNVAAVPEVTDETGMLSERRETVVAPVAPVAPVTRSTPVSPPSAVVMPTETVMQRTPAVVPSVAPSPPVAAVPSPPEPEPAPVAPQQTENLPVWPQVPEYIFKSLRGGLRLDVLVYSDLPRDRFVLVNLQKYREGEQLQEGPLLDAITPDGIVLSLQGQKFLVRAQ